MRKLQYRAPRVAVDFPVQVTHGDSSQPTRGRDISVDGMKLDLDGASFPFTGLITSYTMIILQHMIIIVRERIIPIIFR